MVLDPNQLFTTNTISRDTIAYLLNADREMWNYVHEADLQEITGDDDRLTDEFCILFAKRIGEIDREDCEEAITDAQDAIIAGFLGDLGYKIKKKDPAVIRKDLLDKIAKLEREIAMERTSLMQLEGK